MKIEGPRRIVGENRRNNNDNSSFTLPAFKLRVTNVYLGSLATLYVPISALNPAFGTALKRRSQYFRPPPLGP